MDRLQQLHLVEKDEKTDNVFYKSKFDKIPHISTTRALPSTQKWKWKQQVQTDDQSISYFHFSDYNEKDYTVDGIQPVMPRKPTPVAKSHLKYLLPIMFPVDNLEKYRVYRPANQES